MMDGNVEVSLLLPVREFRVEKLEQRWCFRKSGSPRTEQLYKVLSPTPPCHRVTNKPIGMPWANVSPQVTTQLLHVFMRCVSPFHEEQPNAAPLRC